MEKCYLFKCVNFLQISMCYQRGVPIWFTWGPTYILYLYVQMWLVGSVVLLLSIGLYISDVTAVSITDI